MLFYFGIWTEDKLCGLGSGNSRRGITRLYLIVEENLGSKLLEALTSDWSLGVYILQGKPIPLKYVKFQNVRR